MSLLVNQDHWGLADPGHHASPPPQWTFGILKSQLKCWDGPESDRTIEKDWKNGQQVVV